MSNNQLKTEIIARFFYEISRTERNKTEVEAKWVTKVMLMIGRCVY